MKLGSKIEHIHFLFGHFRRAPSHREATMVHVWICDAKLLERNQVETSSCHQESVGPDDGQPASSAFVPRTPIEVPLVEEIEDLEDIEEEIPQQTLPEDAGGEFPSLDCWRT